MEEEDERRGSPPPAVNSDPVRLFLDEVTPGGEAEASWLKEMFAFISRHVCPLLGGPAPSAADETGGGVRPDVCVSLSVCVVRAVQENIRVAHTLPVSYRPVSISELVSRQRLACSSHLSWSTNEQQSWAREAELSLPGKKALPRVNLLLIGCLREGREGEWRLTDGSGSVRCECLSPSPQWMNCLVFLPHWNYIPHDAPGQDEPGGCVQLIGSAGILRPCPEPGLVAGPEGGAGPGGAVGVGEAAGLLRSRVKGQLMSVYGRVGSVCPLLDIQGVFFFFTLTQGGRSLPVLVKDKLWWSRCVCVGQSVCVTALTGRVLRSWRGNRILCATARSEIHTNYTPTHTPVHTHTAMTSQADDDIADEAELKGDVIQSGVRTKQSKVISYQGTVTEVVSEGAGLYVIDGKVGLCLAYQLTLRRKLRAGDRVELHGVHFLYRPCPDFPPGVLCACLRSSLRVTSFSAVGGAPPDATCPGDGALPWLLPSRNMEVTEYLWACHLSSQLSCSLFPRATRRQCVCEMSWKVTEFVWRRGGRGGRGGRDIYSEMLDEPHTCPLTRYRAADPAVPRHVSVSELDRTLRSDCWSSVSLGSLLPPGGSGLTGSEINAALAWSCRTLSSEPRSGETLGPRPPLLVGVLDLHASKRTLQLRDATGAVSCVATETSEEEEGGQRAAFNTAWIGCLVCVRQFTMVTERFLQSDFPSYQHLDQDRFITHKDCRVYLQFTLDHALILRPSHTMVQHLRQRRAGSGSDVTDRKETTCAHATGRKSRRGEEEAPGPSPSAPSVAVTTGPAGGGPRSCVSVVLVVKQKEGVDRRNAGAGSEAGGAGLTPCFTLRAVAIGPVVCWDRDPQNGPMMDREVQEEEGKVVLVFCGASARWFPVLQAGCFYRLVAADTQDSSVLIGCGVAGRSGVELHTDSTLLVQSEWRFHTLTRPLLLPTCAQARSPTVLSVSEVLDCSSDLVCFQGLVSDRISISNRTTESGPTIPGVRLTMCDQSGRSLQVYMDLSHTPYSPGLLPGNTLLLSAFQRRVSRSGGVYCRYLPVSSVTVISLAATSSAGPPPATMMHLGLWEQSRAVGRVKGHVVRLLLLQLRWSCSLCGSVYAQSCSSAQCRSTSSVFQAKAKLVIEDGTGEAHVWFSGALVRPALGLADSQWEGLQRALRVKGHVKVYPRSRSLVCDADADDSLGLFLLCVCSSEVLCRPLSLTCRKHNYHRPEETRRFSEGGGEFVTRLAPPLQLTCLHVNADLGASRTRSQV